MDMRRTPVVGAVAPGVRTRLDGAEAVVALAVGQGPADATKVGVQRRQVAVVLVPVAATGVGLPDLDQGVRDRFAVLVADAAGQDDALTDRQAAVVEVEQQVVVVRAELEVREIRAGAFADRLRDAHQRLARRTGDGSLVVRGEGFRVPVAITDSEATVVLRRHAVLLSWNYWSAWAWQASLQFPA
ncbi:hypothetical protein D3C78_1360610 [compost metagenome]